MSSGAKIFATWVSDPERYGVVDLDKDGNIRGLIEKPKVAPSNWAVAGLYFFDYNVSSIAKSISPSPRGELEILDVIKQYLEEDKLEIEKLGRGYAWLDTGTPQSLLEAATFVQTLQQRQGLGICCPEEIALSQKFISLKQFKILAKKYSSSEYGKLLNKTIQDTSK